jgi:hypothetical protein
MDAFFYFFMIASFKKLRTRIYWAATIQPIQWSSHDQSSLDKLLCLTLVSQNIRFSLSQSYFCEQIFSPLRGIEGQPQKALYYELAQ